MGKQWTSVEYLGGWPGLDPKHKIVLQADDAGLHVRAFRELLMIPWAEVTEVITEGPEAAERRITATRLITTGVFAFAFKKKTGSAYLEVAVTDGRRAAFMIPKTGAVEVRAALARWTGSIAGKTPVPPPPPAPDLSGELAKLADLHQAGVLSAEEFAAAKARLLA